MRSKFQAAALALCALMLPAGRFIPAAQAQPSAPGGTAVIPAAQLMQPEELNRILEDSKAARPLVLQVGSRVLFQETHIAGSEYAGPGSSDQGLGVLRDRVKNLPRQSFIVIYCGCCPWNRCPNLGPAYQMLHAMGFTRLKALYIAQNFGADWAAKGYPIAKGQ